MTSKTKKWSLLTTAELANATREFDDPNTVLPKLQPTKAESAALARVRQKSKNSFRIALALEKKLVEQTDEYAAHHGITFSAVVTHALRQLIRKKSA